MQNIHLRQRFTLSISIQASLVRLFKMILALKCIETLEAYSNRLLSWAGTSMNYYASQSKPAVNVSLLHFYSFSGCGQKPLRGMKKHSFRLWLKWWPKKLSKECRGKQTITQSSLGLPCYEHNLEIPTCPGRVNSNVCWGLWTCIMSRENRGGQSPLDMSHRAAMGISPA